MKNDVRELRVTAGLSQRELAETLGGDRGRRTRLRGHQSAELTLPLAFTLLSAASWARVGP